MRLLRGHAAAARRWAGRTVHRHGGALRSDVRQLQVQLDGLSSSLSSLYAEGAAAAYAHADLSARLATSENLLAIDAFGRFIRHSRLRTAPLVSVVLPTYDRPDRLARAIESVQAQRYPRWELLVVEDGGRFDSEAVVQEAADARITWTRIEHAGVCAARNAALSRSSGELIAYLDDDNVMDVDWLYSIVWGFEQYPAVDVLYGAIVVDDALRVNGTGSGDLPRAYLSPWSREALREGNLADIGAMAHRTGLAEARFDESLKTVGDWDLLVRLTAERDPLVLPAVACYYSTDAAARLTGGLTQTDDMARVRARVRR